MGKRNYLIEGVSGTGKTSVSHELRRRGYAALNSDRDLRQHTDPTTGERLITFSSPKIRHASNLWDVEKARRLAANQDDEVTFFCGGSRNFNEFIDLFDEIFILDVNYWMRSNLIAVIARYYGITSRLHTDCIKVVC